jgi:hypothetical protein
MKYMSIDPKTSRHLEPPSSPLSTPLSSPLSSPLSTQHLRKTLGAIVVGVMILTFTFILGESKPLTVEIEEDVFVQVSDRGGEGVMEGVMEGEMEGGMEGDIGEYMRE